MVLTTNGADIPGMNERPSGPHWFQGPNQWRRINTEQTKVLQLCFGSRLEGREILFGLRLGFAKRPGWFGAVHCATGLCVAPTQQYRFWNPDFSECKLRKQIKFPPIIQPFTFIVMTQKTIFPYTTQFIAKYTRTYSQRCGSQFDGFFQANTENDAFFTLPDHLEMCWNPGFLWFPSLKRE